MKIDINNWTYTDFITLIYIQVVSSDYCISENEHDSIVAEVGKAEYKKVLKKFIRLSDAEVFNLMMDLAKIFCFSEEMKNKTYQSIQEMIYIDGHKSILEENMFRMLKKIL